MAFNLDPINKALTEKAGIAIAPVRGIVAAAATALVQHGQAVADQATAAANAGLDQAATNEGAVSSALSALGLDALAPLAPVIMGLALAMKRSRDGAV